MRTLGKVGLVAMAATAAVLARPPAAAADTFKITVSAGFVVLLLIILVPKIATVLL